MHNRRLTIALAIGLVVAVVTAVSWVVVRAEPSAGPLSEARQIVAAKGPSDAARDANEVAVAATLIAQELQQCRRETPGPRCTGLAAALGYAQVTAARMIRCDANGRVASRRALGNYLDRVARIAPDAARDDPVGQPPTLPNCGTG